MLLFDKQKSTRGEKEGENLSGAIQKISKFFFGQFVPGARYARI